MSSDAIGPGFLSGSIDRIADDEHSLSLYHEMHRAIPGRVLPSVRPESEIPLTMRFETRGMRLASGCSRTNIEE